MPPIASPSDPFDIHDPFDAEEEYEIDDPEDRLRDYDPLIEPDPMDPTERRRESHNSDDRKAFDSVLDQLSDPEEFRRSTETIDAQPDAESFDLVQFKDGRRFERYSTGRRIEGVANARVWSFRDVTAKFTAEAALRDSELRYRLLFEQNAAGVCVTKIDGEIADCNTTWASI